jgi:hypothetical protein
MNDKPKMFTANKVAKVVTITPELAENWLRFNTRNRTIDKNRVASYKQLIEDGMWKFNGEAIVFNTDGGLNNGQHRLGGCAASGKSIESVVVWGATPDSIITIDRGRARTLRDNLTIMRDKKNRDLASVLKSCVIWFERGQHNGRAMKGSGVFQHEEAIAYFDAHPEIMDFDLYKGETPRRIATPSVLWFAHYLCAQVDGTDADYFFDHILTGHQGSNPMDETIFRTRETLMSRREDLTKEKDVQLALILIGWNKFRAGETPKLIRWTGKGANAQKFPEPH